MSIFAFKFLSKFTFFLQIPKRGIAGSREFYLAPFLRLYITMTFWQVSDHPRSGPLTPVANAFKRKQAGSILYGIWFLLLKKCWLLSHLCKSQ